MLKTNLLALLLCVGFLTFTACDDDDTGSTEATLSFSITPTVDNARMDLNQDYINESNQKFMVELFKTYLSDIHLVKDDGTEELLADVAWYNIGASELLLFSGVDVGSYSTIKMGLGLNPTLNASDPTTFDVDHPLSGSQGNYWSWASKYIFVKLEGRFNEDAAATNYTGAFVYHVGLDQFYREIEIPINLDLAGDDNKSLAFTIAMEDVFADVNFAEEFTTHTMDDMPLAEKMMNNFESAFMQ